MEGLFEHGRDGLDGSDNDAGVVGAGRGELLVGGRRRRGLMRVRVWLRVVRLFVLLDVSPVVVVVLRRRLRTLALAPGIITPGI